MLNGPDNVGTCESVTACISIAAGGDIFFPSDALERGIREIDCLVATV
jgi:hypothetical protein